MSADHRTGGDPPFASALRFSVTPGLVGAPRRVLVECLPEPSLAARGHAPAPGGLAGPVCGYDDTSIAITIASTSAIGNR